MKTGGKGFNMGKSKGSGSGVGQGGGMGGGQGRGQGRGQYGGQGRNKGGAFGPGGYCVCAKCGEQVPHEKGIKCTTLKCPKCGHTLIREELLKKKK
jgi:hypothetical protein